MRTASARRAGFTLIELMVVMAIVALLLTLAVPRYFGSLEKARETALQQTLATTRDALDKFYADTGKYPETLDELVARRYLRALPIDPLTDSRVSWQLVAPDDASQGGVADLRSSADGIGRNGKPFRDW